MTKRSMTPDVKFQNGLTRAIPTARSGNIWIRWPIAATIGKWRFYRVSTAEHLLSHTATRQPEIVGCNYTIRYSNLANKPSFYNLFDPSI
jgi:hypothetical protein